MKLKKQWKKKFAIMSVSTLTIASTLSIVLTSCSNGSGLKIENLIKPQDNEGKFMKYGTRKVSAGAPVDTEVEINYEKVVNGLLKDYSVSDVILTSSVKNIIVNWFAGIKKSKNFFEQYETMQKDINKSWDDLVKNTKSQYGDSWKYHMQSGVLNQYGGTYENWYYAQLSSKILSSFDTLLTSNISIGIEGVTDTLSHKDLFDPTGKVWSGYQTGGRNNISFTSGVTSSQDFAIPISDFWEFVFDKYVKEKMPLVTSMVLFKHETTSNLGDFFDVNKIKQYPGYETNDIVGTAGTYKWQAYPNKTIISPTGAWNSTDKYNHFIANYGNNGAKAVNTNLGGAINIDVKYTDDSATLYRINLDDVFNTSFTPYAAAATYKFNNGVLGVEADANIAKKNELNTTLMNNQEGTEIMGNFLSTNASEAGHFQLSDIITNILNKNNATPGFIAKYDGVKSIADIVNIENTPFILARNEAGVHIIGIDRLEAIKTAAQQSYQGMINEIKNTLLWRSLVGQNEQEKAATGFTLDLIPDLTTFYQGRRDELIYQYIQAKEAQRGTNGSGTAQKWASKGNENYDKKKYLFSSVYTSTTWKDGIPNFDDNGDLIQATDEATGEYDKLLQPELVKYIDPYLNHLNYKSFGDTPTDITNKLLSTQDPYEGKWYTASLIENGLAGQISFTPTIPTPGADLSADAPNNKMYFPKLLQLIPLGGNDQPLDKANTYKEAKFDEFTTAYRTAADTYFTHLNGGVSDANVISKKITLKEVDYPEFEENIYLTSEAETQKETKTFINMLTSLSIEVNQKFSFGFKSVAEIEKTLAAIDDRVYKWEESKPSSMLAQPATAPTDPSAEASTVNYYIEQAITKNNRVNSFTSGTASATSGQWISTDGTADYSNLLKIAESTAKKDVKQKYSNDALSKFKQILAYQYAFDFDRESGEYKFTKFRDYLLNSTQNFQKAAFVWKTSDYLGAFTDNAATYGKALDTDFSFKTPVRINNLINGYSFKGSPKIALGADSRYDGTKVTLTQDSTLFNQVAMKSAAGDKQYIGFKGIQFQVSNNLAPEEANSVFNSNVYVPDGANWKIQGTLFNLGEGAEGKAELKKRINSLNNIDQITKAASWFDKDFNLDTTKVYEVLEDPNATISDAIAELAKLVDSLDEAVFNRVQGLQVANSAIVNTQPESAKFFGTDNTAKSQIIVSQFNYKDVVSLFDTNGDQVIDENDKGIKIEHGKTNGFLGQSFEAFMQAAFQWASNDQTFLSIAYSEMLKVQNNIDTDQEDLKKLLVETYSRPLNDEFGKDWAANYKESVKVK